MFKKGFTLIELMVAVLIIMVLSGTIIVSVDYSRKKARDSKRIADLNIVASALESYYSENQTYPTIHTAGALFPGSGTYRYPMLMGLISGTGGEAGYNIPYLSDCPRDPSLTIPAGSSPCNSTSAFGALSGCTDTGCPAGSNPFGYRYTCWDKTLKDDVSGPCIHYLLGGALELEDRATLPASTPTITGKPEYKIYDGEPCYSELSCTPPTTPGGYY